jgi:hypothetical protein
VVPKFCDWIFIPLIWVYESTPAGLKTGISGGFDGENERDTPAFSTCDSPWSCHGVVY